MSRLSEVKVGMLVIAALLVLGGVLYFLLGPGKVGRAWPLEIVFEDAKGLTGGEPVRMAGVQIGRVREVSLAANRKASVRVLIRQGIPLYDNYLFTISTGALVPERFVDVEPVSIAEGGKELRPGDTVQGLESPGLQEIVTTARGMLRQLEQTAASVNAIVGDPAVVRATKTALAHFETTARQAAAMMANLEGISREARPHLTKAAQEIALASEEAKAAVSHLSARIQRSTAPEEIEAAAAAAKEAAQRAREIATGLRELLAEPGWQGDFRASLANFREMSESLKQAAANLRAASEEVKESAPRIRNVAERAEGVLGDVGQWKERLRPPQVKPNFSFLASPRAERSLTDASFDLSFAGEPRRFLRMGMADIGEENQVNLQAGRRLGDRSLRYGLVRSKLGVGADTPIVGEGRLSIDVLDPNRLRADLTADYPLGGRESGWGVIFGMRDAFGENLGFAGARFGR